MRRNAHEVELTGANAVTWVEIESEELTEGDRRVRCRVASSE